MQRKILNPEFLENWREVDPLRWRLIVAELLETFFRTIDESYRQMVIAREEGDWETIRTLAHSMKSSFGVIGAEEAHRLLQTIEILAAAKRYRRANVFMARFDLIFVETRALAIEFQRANAQAA